MDYTKLAFHPTMERLVEILMGKTQNNDPMFFRLLVSYFFAKLASMMRTSVALPGMQNIPVNMYAINLAASGSGKGHSISVMEEQIINQFRHRFLHLTFPTQAAKNIDRLAVHRANKNKTDPESEKSQAFREFEDAGAMVFSFDSATSAAIKQLRHKLLMANAGSMNMEIDEIGSNLLGNIEALVLYLELFDRGITKQKLVKNTRDNRRSEDLAGSSPTNMLLFGTAAKLLNGSKIEDEFYEMLDIGYARRCFFAFSRRRKTPPTRSAQDLLDLYNDTSVSDYMAKLSDRLGALADMSNFGHVMEMRDDVKLELFNYRLRCERNAERFNEYEEAQRAEMAHRYFKTLKLATTYAFIDSSIYVEMNHLENAIALAEQSGHAFSEILNRDRPYVKLANYMASINRQVTHADLVEDLPFYKGSEATKREMLTLAIAYGYKNGIYIRRDFTDGIELLSGKSVSETDLEAMIVSYGTKIAEGFRADTAPFNKLHVLTNAPNYHWVTHHLKDGYRNEVSCIPGMNLIVIDVDGNVSIDMAKMLLKDYKWLMHTTKRHTDKEHRFRIIFPISHILELDAKDYKEFMEHVFDWVPFQVDRMTGQRSRKWLTHNGAYWYNDGQVLDALQFVPKTKRAEEHRQKVISQSSLSALERWFVNQAEDGNRSNMLIRYAYCLIDLGQDPDTIRNNVMALNNKIAEPLDEAEVLRTIIVSATNRYHLRKDD